MQVKNQVFFHIHRKNYEDEKWKVGNEIVIDKNSYNGFFGYYVNYNINRFDNSIPDVDKLTEYAMLIVVDSLK